MIRAILSILTLLVAVLGAGIAYVQLSLPPPGPERIEVSPEIVGIRAGSSYAWLIHRGEDAVLIDAGSDPEGTAILAELSRRGIERLDAVLLTHAHRDQAAAVAVLGAPVYVGHNDHPLLIGDTEPKGLLSRPLARLQAAVRPPSVVREVLPAERLQFGAIGIDVISVPAHTRGSVAYVHQPYLFSGEALIASEDGAVGPAPWFLSDQPENFERIMPRLLKGSWTVLLDGRTGKVLGDGRAQLEKLAARAQ